MTRSIYFLVKILQLVSPSFPDHRGAAELLNRLGGEHGFDPVTLVAIADHESRWKTNARNSKSGALGLTQVLPTNFPECREVPKIDRCYWRESFLLTWGGNLTIAARYIEANREYCKKKVGSGRMVYWLQAFVGYDAKRETTCGMRKVRGRWKPLPTPDGVKWIVKRRSELISQMVRR